LPTRQGLTGIDIQRFRVPDCSRKKIVDLFG